MPTGRLKFYSCIFFRLLTHHLKNHLDFSFALLLEMSLTVTVASPVQVLAALLWSLVLSSAEVGRGKNCM